MGVVFGLLLIVLGVLAARDFLGERIASSKNFIDKVAVYSEYLGVAGLVLGIVWLLDALTLIGIGLPLLFVLKIWVSSGLLIALGLIFGWSFILKIIKEPHPAFFATIGKWRDGLLGFKQQLGLAAMVFGLLCIL